MHILKTLTIIGLFSMAACTVVEGPGEGEDANAANSAAAADTSATYNAAQQAYHAANGRMHAGMAAIDEDADIAFIQGMIPHHKGAVDMAKIVLQYGDDEEAKELARDIIAAQEKEIAWMESWLEKRGLQSIKPGDNMGMIDHEAMGH